jgi:phospholipid/cholesterol/gamma-HCH transport system substrate-binding protein
VTAIRKHLGDFVALAVLFVIALGVGGYIMSQQESRPKIPFIEDKPFTIKVALSDSQAVTPGQGQSVRVAGVKVGLIKKVQLNEGHAVVTVAIDKKYVKDLDLTTDTTALLRPQTGLKDMFIELEPGTRGQKLKENETIPVQNTAPDIDPDEFLSALDSDTRTYLQLLINGAGKGFKGHGNDLREVFRRLGPTERSLRKVTGAIADRRTEMRRLITNYGSLLDELGDKDKQLVNLVDESNAVFESFASQEGNVTASVQKLAPTLRTTSQTLNKVQTFAPVLQSSLESLRPAVRQIDNANREVLPFVREAEPIVRNHIRPFVRESRPYVRNLRPAAVNLAEATPDLTASIHELNRFFNMGSYNPGGRNPVTGVEATDRNRDEGYLFWLAWLAQHTNSIFSTGDATGPFRRALAGFSCTGIKETLASQPAAGGIIGLTNVLNTPGLCGGDASETPGGPVVPGLPIGTPKSGEGIHRNGKADSTDPTKVGGRPQADSSPKKSEAGK